MPAMTVQASTIPALIGKKDCWGLFPQKPIKKSTIVAVYGGKLMERTYAEINNRYRKYPPVKVVLAL
jgi:hypothetical protein